MRPRSRRRPRHCVPLDAQQYYAQEWGGCLMQVLELAWPSGDQFEIEFFETILRRAPDHPEALTALGELYARRGEYQKGLDTDLHLSRLRPRSGPVHYNLACSYALNGRRDEALAALSRAVELGYRDPERLRRERGLACLKDDPRFQTLLRQIEASALGESAS